MKTYKLPKDRVLVLRTCASDMSSRNDFVWPKAGPVVCPDWEPINKCGNGLHGLLWGEGDGDLLNWGDDAIWLVVEVAQSDVIDLKQKVKFPCGIVVFCGDRAAATQFIYKYAPQNTAVVGAMLMGGYEAMLMGGNNAKLTGGNRAKLTGGNRAKLTGGDWSTLTGGDWSTLTGGNNAKLTGGDWSTLTGGNRAMLTGGYGTKFTGGEDAVFVVRHFQNNKFDVAVAIVGKDGIKPNTTYSYSDKHGRFIEVV